MTYSEAIVTLWPAIERAMAEKEREELRAHRNLVALRGPPAPSAWDHPCHRPAILAL